MRCADCRSVQLKIKRHGRDNLDLLAVDPNGFGPPLFHGGDGRIGKYRLTFEKFLNLDTPVLCYAHLKFDNPLNAGALRKSGIRGVWSRDEPLLEIVGIFAKTAG